MNRIQQRIDLIQGKISSGVASAEKLANLEKTMETSWDELFQYQNAQARAHAMGKISSEEAMLLYNLLGRENPTEEKWNQLSLAQKVAVTQVMAELLEWERKMGPGWHAAQRKSRKAPPKKPGPGGLRGLR